MPSKIPKSAIRDWVSVDRDGEFVGSGAWYVRADLVEIPAGVERRQMTQSVRENVFELGWLYDVGWKKSGLGYVVHEQDCQDLYELVVADGHDSEMFVSRDYYRLVDRLVGGAPCDLWTTWVTSGYPGPLLWMRGDDLLAVLWPVRTELRYE